MVAYRIQQLLIMVNPHKNQAQCLLSLTGDAVETSSEDALSDGVVSGGSGKDAAQLQKPRLPGAPPSGVPLALKRGKRAISENEGTALLREAPRAGAAAGGAGAAASTSISTLHVAAASDGADTTVTTTSSSGTRYEALV